MKEENIVVFMYDDIAYNEENPRPGVIINSPNGDDVYKGVPKVCYLVFQNPLCIKIFMISKYDIGIYCCRITLVNKLLSITFFLLYLEISQLLLVAVGRWWIVVPMTTYLYTTLIMVAQECLVSALNLFMET